MKTWHVWSATALIVVVQMVCTFWLIWADREVTCNVKELKFAMLAQSAGQSPQAWLTLKGHCLKR